MLDWNGGEKSPDKVGLVKLVAAPPPGTYVPTHGSRAVVHSGVSSGGAAGLFFLGCFVGPLLIAAGFYAYKARQNGNCPAITLPEMPPPSRGARGARGAVARRAGVEGRHSSSASTRCVVERSRASRSSRVPVPGPSPRAPGRRSAAVVLC